MPDTIKQFAARIKASYPQYSAAPDDELVLRIMGKYPQYLKQLDPASQGIITTHLHNLNVGACKLTDPIELTTTATGGIPAINTGLRPAEVAAVARGVGMFGGPPGAVLGEAAAQDIEKAGGERTQYDEGA